MYSCLLIDKTVFHIEIDFDFVEKATRGRGKRPSLGERRLEFRSQFCQVAVWL